MSIEKTYQKKTQREHVLLRPDTYIGSIEKHTEKTFVYNEKIEYREITYVPGLFKIFDEILVNAADNKQRDKNMTQIHVSIDSKSISIMNDGMSIPIEIHKVEKVYVPTLIFGNLLTSSNFNDSEEKTTGGRNGYGAKLCNIFSKGFIVKIGSSNKLFKQTWTNNMENVSKPEIKEDYKGPSYTKITFYPDFKKFKMEEFTPDILHLFKRRLYDIAATTENITVFLNKKQIEVNNFKDYISMFINDNILIYEKIGSWEIAVANAGEDGFRQISFVNNIATTKGGCHVNYVIDSITKFINSKINKKQNGFKITQANIKNHIQVFINCRIINPNFDTQTKENMTKRDINYPKLPERFFNKLSKSKIMESISSWVDEKNMSKLNTSCNKKKLKMVNIEKLHDAKKAGTKESLMCTLILTEGDSAKTLAMAGLCSVKNREYYGVFPLKGKMLNVRDVTTKKLIKNTEIDSIIKITGLRYNKKYDTKEEIKTLRYGKIMIMTDQDNDGAHIKGLIINFIQRFWPGLLLNRFLEEFITPIITAKKKNIVEKFYSIKKFNDWKDNTKDFTSYKIKYYKGLGTSTSEEAKKYFKDIESHRYGFIYKDKDDENAILMAFSKKFTEKRKEWLTEWMENPIKEDLYNGENESKKQIRYSDFINKSLIYFSIENNERAIPNIMDGLKPCQRKVLFTLLKRSDKNEIKVAQLSGSVAEKTIYHHGEVSLSATIVNMSQKFPGSNNINLLQPIGQFGSRRQGGKDSASPRYIFTLLSPITRKIFVDHDTPTLKVKIEENQEIEPEWYAPVLPMVLINGASGIGTGWMTKIPNYNPLDIAENLKRLIKNEELLPLHPWYNGYYGKIVETSKNSYISYGKIYYISKEEIEISELPIKLWSEQFYSFLNNLIFENKIISYQHKSLDLDEIRISVKMTEENLLNALKSGIYNFFKLYTSFTTTSMVLFNHEFKLRHYTDPNEILTEYYTVRLEHYSKRKAYIINLLKNEVDKLTNQCRFIEEKCTEVIKIENLKKQEIINLLKERKYNYSEGSYEYIFNINILSFSQEKKKDLEEKCKMKTKELEIMKDKSPKDMWLEDLDRVMEEYNREVKIQPKWRSSGRLVKIPQTKISQKRELEVDDIEEPARKKSLISP